MTQVFLNYRSADEPFGVAMLDRELSRRFGSGAVFLASKSIAPGDDWNERMLAAVRESQVLLVVMGRNWLDARDAGGKRRLDDPEDPVRREILLALELRKRVIPVRLGVNRFTPDQLPPPLVGLTALQDVEVRFRNHRADVDHLAAKLRLLVPELHDVPAVASPKFDVSGTAGSVLQAESITFEGDFHAGPAYATGMTPGE